VEDNADNRRAAAMRLRLAGHDVTVASDGQKALDEWERGPDFDAILMDMHMPVLDGYEATRQLRLRGYRGKIVALTAFATDEDRSECLGYGCDEHIAKPVDWTRLLAILGGP
jgi:CheY-like chemotaxis protein